MILLEGGDEMDSICPIAPGSGFGIARGPGQSAEAGVENHPDDSHDEDGEQDAGDIEIIPFDPGQISHAELAQEHFGGYDGDERAAERDAEAGDDRGSGGGQDHGEEPSRPGELEQTRDPEIVRL